MTHPLTSDDIQYDSALALSEAEREDVIRGLLAEIDRLRQQLRSDELTGLANRSGLHEHVARGHGPVASVLLIDLDQFKSINDTFGHRAGDLVLLDTAERLSAMTEPTSNSRCGDLAVRLSGDEFALWLHPQADIAHAGARARDRAEQVARVLARTVDLGYGRSVATSATVGVGVLDGSPEITEVLAAADTDMYRHKPVRPR